MILLEIFFHFVQSFGDFLKVKGFLTIWMVEDPIQMIETVSYIFELYFYKVSKNSLFIIVGFGQVEKKCQKKKVITALVLRERQTEQEFQSTGTTANNV